MPVHVRITAYDYQIGVVERETHECVLVQLFMSSGGNLYVHFCIHKHIYGRSKKEILGVSKIMFVQFESLLRAGLNLWMKEASFTLRVVVSSLFIL